MRHVELFLKKNYRVHLLKCKRSNSYFMISEDESKTGKINCETPNCRNEIPFQFKNITVKAKRSLKQEAVIEVNHRPCFLKRLPNQNKFPTTMLDGLSRSANRNFF